MGIAGLLVGSIAYYRIVVSWSIEGSTGNAVFVLRDTYRPYIRTITFGNDLSNLPSSCAGDSDLCWDVSDAGSKKKVYAYLIDSGLKDENEQSLYNLYIVSEAPIFAPPDCSLFFAGFNNLISINYNNNFNTSKVTNMNYMFLPIRSDNGDWSSAVTLTSSIKNVKPSFLVKTNDAKIEMMLATADYDFYSVIEKLDLSRFNTTKVTDMSNMFSNCSSLISLDLSSFNTTKVTDMGLMFYGCSSLTSLDLSSFNILNVTDMGFMFQGCISINNLDISTFYISALYIITNVQFKSLTTTINYIGTVSADFSNIQSGHITINYTSSNESVVDSMVANYPYILIKGKLITAPTTS